MAEYSGFLTSESEAQQRLNLAFENLDHIPLSIIASTRSIKILDLSHNNFSNLSFLKYYSELTCLIMDHNYVSSRTEFPPVPSLRVLWLNHNHVSQLFPFVQRLHAAFPNLRVLSLMSNEAVPTHVDDSTFYEYLQYRLFVVSWFRALTHLDDRPVTDGERDEAQRLYKRPLLERIVNKEPVSKVLRTITSAIGMVHKKDHSDELSSSFI